MQIRAGFEIPRGFFVHWFIPVYTRLKHGYVDFSPRNPRGNHAPLVTRIRIVKPAKGYWFNFDKYRVAPFHRHSPRFIRSILAFFFLPSPPPFFFYSHNPLTLPLGLGWNTHARRMEGMLQECVLAASWVEYTRLYNYWTKLNLFCGIGLIDGWMDAEWESRVIRNRYFPYEGICERRKYSLKNWPRLISFCNTNIE